MSRGAGLCLLAAAALALAGCAPLVSVQQNDGVDMVVRAPSPLKPGTPKLPLRACVDNRADSLETRRVFQKAFDEVRLPPFQPHGCDLMVTIADRAGYPWSIRSNYFGAEPVNLSHAVGRASEPLDESRLALLYSQLATRHPKKRTLREHEYEATPSDDIEPTGYAYRNPQTTGLTDVDSPVYRAPEKPHDFAVVVGIEQYADLPPATFAERDAASIRSHLYAMGVPPRNVVYLANSRAGRAALAKNIEEWLPQVVEADSRVFFYFSGHGSPDLESGAAYLVPWDGDPSFLKTTAYPLKRLYQQLAKLPAKRVIVAIDACFSGQGGRSVVPTGVRAAGAKVEVPSEDRAGMIVLTAARGTEVSNSLPDKGHGAFTYFLLRGLAGEAKDDDGRVTAHGLYRYLYPKVQNEARRQNRSQTPQLMGAVDVVVR